MHPKTKELPRNGGYHRRINKTDNPHNVHSVMTRKIIFAGACTLFLLAAIRLMSAIVLSEHGQASAGGEICLVIIAFCVYMFGKTINDIRKRRR